MDVTELAQNEWASMIEFMMKKDLNISISINYRKLKVLKVRYPYSILPMDKYNASLAKQRYYRRYTPIAVICKSRTSKKTK